MQTSEIIFDWKYFLVAVFYLFIVLFIITLLVIPVKMATKRGRSGFLWFMFSLLLSPVLSMLLIYFLGETDEKRKERIREEEQLRNLYRVPAKGNSESNIQKWLAENPSKSLNDYYRFK